MVETGHRFRPPRATWELLLVALHWPMLCAVVCSWVLPVGPKNGAQRPNPSSQKCLVESVGIFHSSIFNPSGASWPLTACFLPPKVGQNHAVLTISKAGTQLEFNDHLRNRRWGETNKTSSRGWLRTSKDDKDCDSGRIICNWSIHYTLPCSPILKEANLTWRTCKPELLSTFCRAWAAKHKHILHCRWINRDRFAAWLGACLWWAGQRKMMPHGNPGQKHLTHWKKTHKGSTEDRNTHGETLGSPVPVDPVVFTCVHCAPWSLLLPKVLSAGHASALLYVMLHLTGNGLGGPYDSQQKNSIKSVYRKDTIWGISFEIQKVLL